MTEPIEPPVTLDRRNNTTVIVLVATILFLAMRVYDAASDSHSAKHTRTTGSSSDLNAAAMDDLIDTDTRAKSAFVYAYYQRNGRLDRDLLEPAEKSAEDLDVETDNSPGAARRLMVLRALMGDPPLAATSKGKLPLNAFGADLPPGTLPVDRMHFASEAILWRKLLGCGARTSAQSAELTGQIPRLNNIRWWAEPALVLLSRKTGETAKSAMYVHDAAERAAASLVFIGALGLLRVAMLLAGVVLIFLLIWNGWQSPAFTQPALWPSESQTVLMAARKLRAVDLFSVFVCYLLAREALEITLSGFAGIGRAHVLAFHGLASTFLPRIDRMAPSERATVQIVVESAMYILSAVPPLILLRTLARTRGASLAMEIGLANRRLGANALYGIGGLCIAMPVLLAGYSLTQHALRNFPAPSNPVIPQLVYVNSPAGILLLVAVASFAAPFVEETLFRGVLYTALKIRTGVWPAIIISGLVFGFAHPVGVEEMITLSLLGSIFAWMAETRQSLVPSMVAHCIFNLTTAVLLVSVMGS